MGNRLDFLPVPQKVVQRTRDFVAAQTKENMNARRLNVRINDTDALSARGKNGGDICRRIRLAGAAAKRVNGNYFCHNGYTSMLNLELLFYREWVTLCVRVRFPSHRLTRPTRDVPREIRGLRAKSAGRAWRRAASK